MLFVFWKRKDTKTETFKSKYKTAGKNAKKKHILLFRNRIINRRSFNLTYTLKFLEIFICFLKFKDFASKTRKTDANKTNMTKEEDKNNNPGSTL